jgi:hypothetical protein
MLARDNRRLPSLCLGFTAALVAFVATQPVTKAQAPAPATQAPRTPRAAAPIDLVGNWVSVVTEEWLWRMTTPRKGDYTSIPLSEEGRKVADRWDPATDGSCQAFGAAGLMRQPMRLTVAWQGDDIIKVETDAGQQTRLLRFGAPPTSSSRSLQGDSVAAWEPIGGPPVMRNGARVGGAAPQGGTLKVVTTNLAEGWLRKNGVAYSEATTLTEYWDRMTFPNGDTWLVVTSIVSDPTYLLNEYTTSTHFKREPDGSKWRPTPCRQL